MPEILASTFVLAVRDLSTSKRFYVDKLGFAEDLSVDGWAFLSRGDALPDAVRSELVARGAKPWPPRQARPKAQQTSPVWVRVVGFGCLISMIAVLVCAIVGALAIIGWVTA